MAIAPNAAAENRQSRAPTRDILDQTLHEIHHRFLSMIVKES
jgi:hypothetical protein